MRRKKRNFWWLILGLAGLVVLTAFIFIFPPQGILNLIVFFGLTGLSAAFLISYLSNNVRRGFFFALGLNLWLLLRYFGLKQAFYPLLLICALGSLELILKKR